MNKTIKVCAALLIGLALSGCTGVGIQKTAERIRSLNDTPEETAAKAEAKAKAEADKKAAEERAAEEKRARQVIWDRYLYAVNVQGCGEVMGSPSMYKYGTKRVEEALKDAWWKEGEVTEPSGFSSCKQIYNSLVAKEIIPNDKDTPSVRE